MLLLQDHVSHNLDFSHLQMHPVSTCHSLNQQTSAFLIRLSLSVLSALSWLCAFGRCPVGSWTLGPAGAFEHPEPGSFIISGYSALFSFFFGPISLTVPAVCHHHFPLLGWALSGFFYPGCFQLCAEIVLLSYVLYWGEKRLLYCLCAAL